MNLNPDNPLPLEVSEANFESEVLQSKLPVLVAFLAPWSHPCHIVNVTLDEVARACAGHVKVVKVNADNNPELSIWYGIESIPALFYFVEGNVHATLIGTVSKEAILAKLHSLRQGSEIAPFTPNANKIK